MSEYIKRTWVKGEEITAEKLNNIETGIVEARKASEQVVPITRTINGKALSTDIVLTSEDVKITTDAEVLEGSENPVSGGAVKAYVDTALGDIETLLAAL